MKHNVLITAGRILEHHEENQYLKNKIVNNHSLKNKLAKLNDEIVKQKPGIDSYLVYQEFMESLLEEEKEAFESLETDFSTIRSNRKRINSLQFAFFEEEGKEETKHMLDIVYSDISEAERSKILDSIVAKKM